LKVSTNVRTRYLILAFVSACSALYGTTTGGGTSGYGTASFRLSLDGKSESLSAVRAEVEFVNEPKKLPMIAMHGLGIMGPALARAALPMLSEMANVWTDAAKEFCRESI